MKVKKEILTVKYKRMFSPLARGGMVWLLFVFFNSYSQKITYYSHIQPILEKHCLSCHKKGGIGPFVLDNYNDVAKRSDFIKKVTEIHYMPPFPADRTFQQYANERGLSDAEITLIQQWVKDGALEGKNKKKESLIKDKITLNTTSRPPDLVLKMQNAFTIPNTGEEEFRYFHIPTGLTEDVMIETIEFIPGNRKVLHHSRVMIDTTGRMAGLEGLHATDPHIAEFQKIRMADEFLYGWVPGNDRINFPEGTAKRIWANSNLILYMHYSPSGILQTDQSEIRLYFAKKPVKREIKSLILHEQHITNPPFLIRAKEIQTFYMSIGPTQLPISAISILPHAHWLGKSFKVFAIKSDGDFIPLIKIDKWDFNWQMTYQFSKLLAIPMGSVIMAEATYDNTESNLLNPFKPPKDIGFGWNTNAEMMELVIYYITYQEGDEYIKQ